jgi:hypothetical protein
LVGTFWDRSNRTRSPEQSDKSFGRSRDPIFDRNCECGPEPAAWHAHRADQNRSCLRPIPARKQDARASAQRKDTIVKHDGVYSAKSDRENDLSSHLSHCVVAGDRTLHFVLPECQYRAKSRLTGGNESHSVAVTVPILTSYAKTQIHGNRARRAMFPSAEVSAQRGCALKLMA